MLKTVLDLFLSNVKTLRVLDFDNFYYWFLLLKYQALFDRSIHAMASTVITSLQIHQKNLRCGPRIGLDGNFSYTKLGLCLMLNKSTQVFLILARCSDYFLYY